MPDKTKECCRQNSVYNTLYKLAATYSPTWFSSTIGTNGLNFSVRNGGLTSLFGMDRGGSPSLLPPLYLLRERLGSFFSQSYQTSRFEAFGILVLLGFVITDFTPAAYLRSSLLRPSWKSHLGASFALRCFQRLSLPYIDTRLCNWRHNR